nr:Tyr p 41 allergen [Tyrophagus putrescentiae]
MVNVKYTKIFINNEWVDSVSGKTFPVINPTTEEKYADIAEGDKADADKAVAAAVAAFRLNSPWRKLDPSARGRLLNKLADLLERDIEELAALGSLESGKLVHTSTFEVQASVAALRYVSGWADKIHGKTIPADGGVTSFTRIEPVGVCLAICPFNFPLLLTFWKIGPALACGNVCIVKPSEKTPVTALYLASLVAEAGFPPGVLNVVPGYGHTAGAALVEHPQVNKISFTGSTATGKLIAKKASATLKRVSLELGGKSPLVVTPNFDVQTAAAIAHAGCFFHQGQLCIAATRTFVHESIYEEFVAASAALAEKAVLGDPALPTTTQGPQIDSMQMVKILDLIESGKKQGARLVTGGGRATAPEKGYFIQPTVFADVTDEMRIAREEIFGPVQQILKYSTLEEAIERANNTKYGLAAGILTNDINEALKFSNEIQAGTVWVNTYMQTSMTNPFGGVKESGIGREMGEDGMTAYCEIKTVTIKLN